MPARALLVLALLPFVVLGAAPASAVDEGTTATAQPRDIGWRRTTSGRACRFGDFTRRRDRHPGARRRGRSPGDEQQQEALLADPQRALGLLPGARLPAEPDHLRPAEVRVRCPARVQVIARSRGLHGELGDHDDKKDSKATVVRLVRAPDGRAGLLRQRPPRPRRGAGRATVARPAAHLRSLRRPGARAARRRTPANNVGGRSS